MPTVTMRPSLHLEGIENTWKLAGIKTNVGEIQGNMEASQAPRRPAEGK